MSNSHAKSAAALGRRHGGRRVSRLGRAGPCPLAKPRGGAPSGASSIALHTLRRARPLGEGNAAPLGAPRGGGRATGPHFAMPGIQAFAPEAASAFALKTPAVTA